MFSVSNLNGSPSITSVPPSAASVIFFSPRSPALNEPPTSPVIVPFTSEMCIRDRKYPVNVSPAAVVSTALTLNDS